MFREPFMFILSFPLDICGNPTTLGCQMTIDPVRPLWRTNGTFPRANTLQSWDARYGLKPIPSGSKTEGKLLYSYGIMLSFDASQSAQHNRDQVRPAWLFSRRAVCPVLQSR